MEKKYQIFISSTFEDLKEERKKVQDTILSMYHFPIGMEMFSAADEEQWEIIKETIDSSDYYVLIIATRYGTVFENGKDKGMSYTEKEYRYAKSRNIPVLAFVIDKSVPRLENQRESSKKSQKKLGEFIEEVKTGRMVEYWLNAEDLAIKVMNSLNKNIARGKRPGWIRSTNFVSELSPLYYEAIDLRKMKCYISQNNKINGIVTLVSEYNRNENGHIIYFVNNDKKVKQLKDEFIMLAYTYSQTQNWVKYYYNDYGLFFSVRGSQNIKNVQVEIKEKNISLNCVLYKKFDLEENKTDYFIRLRDCEIRRLANIREICFTIYNDFYNDTGNCEFEVCDVLLKRLPTNK